MNQFKLDARDAWNAGAGAFIHFVESGADFYRHLVHGPGLLAACGDVRGTKALDLGCGQGYFSRLLAHAGASVTGVDLSDNLFARAVKLEAGAPLGITFLHLDAAHIGRRFDEASFDLVTACMSMQDMCEPAAVLSAACRILNPKGRVVFSVPHPCTDMPVREWQRDRRGRKLALCLDRYFESGASVCNWNMKRLQYPWRTPFRRFTLTEWSRLIHDAGFVIRNLAEPRPNADLVASYPELGDCFRMPFFLIFELHRDDN